MLFMGEEWGASQPFPFFCDFDGESGRSRAEGTARGVRASSRNSSDRECPRTHPRSAGGGDLRVGQAATGTSSTEPAWPAGSMVPAGCLRVRAESQVPPLLTQIGGDAGALSRSSARRRFWYAGDFSRRGELVLRPICRPRSVSGFPRQVTAGSHLAGGDFGGGPMVVTDAAAVVACGWSPRE